MRSLFFSKIRKELDSIIKLTFLLVMLTLGSGLSALKAQTSKIDSLENLLQNHRKNDITRVNLLNETASKLVDIKNDKALEISCGDGVFFEV